MGSSSTKVRGARGGVYESRGRFYARVTVAPQVREAEIGEPALREDRAGDEHDVFRQRQAHARSDERREHEPVAPLLDEKIDRAVHEPQRLTRIARFVVRPDSAPPRGSTPPAEGSRAARRLGARPARREEGTASGP